MFHGGAIFVDHATGYIDIRHQVSLNAADTIKSKLMFEREGFNSGVVVQNYHTDNGVFTSTAFMEQLISAKQDIRFSGSGAAHQNGVAERSIQTVVNMARTMMLHAALHAPDLVTAELWPMALDHAVWIYNRIPRFGTGKCDGATPLELWSRSMHVPTRDILGNSHVWGCPVFVLEPKLQKSGVKIPKWAPRSRQGMNMGFSRIHSSLISLVLNLSTRSITAQFHVVFDDYFSTVPSEQGTIDQASWLKLITFPSARLQYIFDESDDPLLSDEWLTPDEALLRQQQHRRDAVVRPTTDPLNTQPDDNIQPEPSDKERKNDGHFHGPNVPNLASEEASVVVLEEAPTPVRRQSVRFSDSVLSDASLTPIRSRPQRARQSPIRYDPGVGSAREWKSDSVAHLAKICESGTWTGTQWNDICGLLALMDTERISLNPIYHPLPQAYLSKKKRDPDTPNYFDAMSGENAEGYWAAMRQEIIDLEKRKTWSIVPRTKAGDEQVVPGTWAFRAKRRPDGAFRKFKARFCCRGDLQKVKEGEGSLDTYAPVVSWITVRLMLIFALILNLKTRQIDFSNAFAQADLTEPVYMELPADFTADGDDCILQLHKSLYGQVEAPKLWYMKLREGMESRGFTTCENQDPCLFISKTMISFSYVDDLCYFYREQKVFDAHIQSFVDDGDKYNWEHTIEGEVEAFLGINIAKNEKDGSFKFTQRGLIDKILLATNMTECNGKPTPCSGDGKPLGTDPHGVSAQADWSYSSVVGMLLYLSGNSRPDIAFAVHQCARFTHAPKESHEAAVVRICRYLQATKDEGLIFHPTRQLRVDVYVDADFCGLFGVEDPHDSVSVKSRTGYVIMIANCPLLWVSKLQSEISLSTQESEYVALSSSLRDVVAIKELISVVVDAIGLDKTKLKVVTRSKAFEDNNAALSLATTKKITPRNRHIGSKWHWFRSFVDRGLIAIEKISTDKQLGDIFTKNLQADKFIAARHMLCGW